MKWSITAERLVQLKRDLLPSWRVSHHAALRSVDPKEIASEFKEDNQRKDLLVLRKPVSNFVESFKIYTNEPALKADLEIKTNLWYEHKFSSEVSEDVKQRFEIFCGGWLHYYDIEVRDGDTDHIISFDWSVPKLVKVYISPRYRPKGMNIYLHMYPPGAGDPPTPKHPPPY